MKLTIKEVNEKMTLIAQLFTNDNDKFNYAIKKLDNNIKKATKEKKEAFEEKVNDLREKYAATYQEGEKKGLYILDERGAYLFTKEDTAKFNEETRPLKKSFELEEVEIEPYFVNESLEKTKNIDLFIREELTNILFRPLEKEQEESKILKIVEDETISSN